MSELCLMSIFVVCSPAGKKEVQGKVVVPLEVKTFAVTGALLHVLLKELPTPSVVRLRVGLTDWPWGMVKIPGPELGVVPDLTV